MPETLTLVEEIKFDEAKLNAAIIHESRVPAGDIFSIFDPALSDKKTADFSSLGFFKAAVDSNVKVATGATPPLCLWVLDVILAKWDQLDMAREIAWYLHQHQPSSALFEKAGFWKLFRAAVQTEAKKNGDSPYLHFFHASNRKDAKANRIENFHSLLVADRVRFVSGDYVNGLFGQLESFTRSVTGRKDDAADVCAMAGLHLQGQLLTT